MGRKGSWFAVIKRFFTSSSKDKAVNCKKATREKRKCGPGKAKHGEINSFIPLTRRPSSTEKILADAEREKQTRTNQVPHRKVRQSDVSAQRSAKFQTGCETVPPVAPNHALASAAKLQPGPSTKRTPIFLNHAQVSATKIQAAYRGYRARRSYRSLKALLRLQAVMRGHGVKQQTANTIRCMQTLVRVQLQIRAGRLQMAERKGAAQITPRMSDKDFDDAFTKWSTDQHLPQNEAPEGRWDSSVLTKEAAEARLRRKVEAVMNRERALAYAYSHQLLKVTPKSARAMLTDLRSARSYPWWWTWLERQIPADQQRSGHVPASVATSRPSSAIPHFGHDASVNAHHRHRHVDAATPRSSVTISISSAQKHLQRPRRRSYLDGRLRDDASLTSCPPFAGVQPNYMTPTASAAAKARAHRQEVSRDKKKRFSFGSIGSLFSNKETSAVGAGAIAGGPQRVMGRGGKHHRATSSIGGMSVNSAVSLSMASFGMRHF